MVRQTGRTSLTTEGSNPSDVTASQGTPKIDSHHQKAGISKDKFIPTDFIESGWFH